jgi:hypothetical protein
VRRSQGSRVPSAEHEEAQGAQQDLNWDGN